MRRRWTIYLAKNPPCPGAACEIVSEITVYSRPQKRHLKRMLKNSNADWVWVRKEYELWQ